MNQQRMSTVARETYEAERRAAAIDATWDAVTNFAGPFSYWDICREVADQLHALGYEWQGEYSPIDQVRPLIRELANAGLLRTVRAFSPPSRPHLFELPTEAI